MKTNIQILFIIALAILFFISCNDKLVEAENEVYVDIPDKIFKQKLIKLGYDLNEDGEISHLEAYKIISIDISQPDPTSTAPEIESIKGIESFPNLERFKCYGNKISGELDLSKNNRLTHLNITSNNVSNIDLSNNKNLVELDVSFNELRNIDLSFNKKLKKLTISGNFIESINLTNNTELAELNSFGNALAGLDLSENTNLKKIFLTGALHTLTSLNISMCEELEVLYLSYIPISKLDISNIKNLKLISLAYLDKLEEICVWKLPLPSDIIIEFIYCNPQIVICK